MIVDGGNTGAGPLGQSECLFNLSQISPIPDQKADADPWVQLAHVDFLRGWLGRGEVGVESRMLRDLPRGAH